MTLESTQQFKVGDIVAITRGADGHPLHNTNTLGLITDSITVGAVVILFEVLAAGVSWWYTEDELVRFIGFAGVDSNVQ